MPFNVRIIDGEIHYEPVAGTTTGWVRSAKHHLPHGYAAAWSHETFSGPNSKYLKLTVAKNVSDLVLLTDQQFAEFKNGGKHLPRKFGKPATKPIDTAYNAATGTPATHVDYKRKPKGAYTQEGDVGPYKSGQGNISENLDTARNTLPATFVVRDELRGIKRIPKHPDDMNRDHMNNQLALKTAGENPNQGIAMAIPQWVHMNGYTWGRTATKPKGAGTRSSWIAANPGLGLFKEIFHELRVYHEGGALSCEVVGSYRYLYKLNLRHYHPAGYGAHMKNPRIDKLLMYYLHAAAGGIGP
jgi:hypothetical protein